MKPIKLLLAGFLFLTSLLNAQTDYLPGYIINNSGDTILGEINYLGDLKMSKICEFRDAEKKITEYSPNDILGFRFKEGKYYVSKEVDNTKIFLEYIIKGRVNIYYMANDKGWHYYIDKQHMRLSEIFYEEDIKNIDNILYEYSSTKHYGILASYMQDDPEIQKRIQRIRIPQRKNLIKLAEEYQNDTDAGEKCIVFEKKRPLIKVSIVPFTGLTKYIGYNNFAYDIGGYIYITSPRSSVKHLFLKTGLDYHNLQVDGDELNVYKIPFQLQYIYNANWLQPKLSMGFNVVLGNSNGYDISETLFSLNLGLDFRIIKNLYLSTGLNSDFPQLGRAILVDNIDFEIISYSFIVGLRLDI